MLYKFFSLCILIGTLSKFADRKQEEYDQYIFIYEEGIDVNNGFLNLIEGKSASIKLTWKNKSHSISKLAFAKYELVKLNQEIEIGVFNDITGGIINPSNYSNMFKIQFDRLKLINIQENLDDFIIRATFIRRDDGDNFNKSYSISSPPLLVQKIPAITCTQEGISFKNLTTVSCLIISKDHAKSRVASAAMVSIYEIVQLAETKNGHYYKTKVEINFFPDVRQQNSIIVVEAYIPENTKKNTNYFTYTLTSSTNIKLHFKEELVLKCGDFYLNGNYFEIYCNTATFQTPELEIDSEIYSKNIRVEQSNSIMYENSFIISINADLAFLNQAITIKAKLGKYTASVIRNIVITEKSPPFNTKIKFENADGIVPPFKCEHIIKSINIDCETSTVKGHANVSIYSPDGVLMQKKNIDHKEVLGLLNKYGYWQCLAINEYGTSVSKILVNVEDIPCYSNIKLQSDLTLKQMNTAYVISRNTNVNIKCSTHSNMLPVYYVLMEGDIPIATNEDGNFRTSNISLTSGNYKCVIINPLGFKESDYITIYIKSIEGVPSDKFYGFITLIIILGALVVILSSIAICIKEPIKKEYFKL